MNGKTRNRLTPHIPTLAQSGLDNYDITGWFALMTHASAPKPMIELLNRHIAATLRMEDVAQRLAISGYEAAWTTPADGSAFVANQFSRFGSMVQRADIADAK